MNVIIHILINDQSLLKYTENLFFNKSLYPINTHHFLVTNLKNPHTELYKNFEQIFYSKNIDALYLSNIIKTIKELKYQNFLILNSNSKQETIKNLSDINEFLMFLTKFPVINHFI